MALGIALGASWAWLRPPAALAGCSVLGVALACGPDFQVYLNSRDAFLKAAIPCSFFREAAQLHPALPAAVRLYAAGVVDY